MLDSHLKRDWFGSLIVMLSFRLCKGMRIPSERNWAKNNPGARGAGDRLAISANPRISCNSVSIFILAAIIWFSLVVFAGHVPRSLAGAG